jgi:GT2 family glycosyltransferase
VVQRALSAEPMRTPILIRDLELTEPIADVALPVRSDNAPYEGVRLLVRMQNIPVGYAHLSADALAASSVADEVWHQLGPSINARRTSHGLPVLTGLTVAGLSPEADLDEAITTRPFVSVIMNTRDRPDSAVATARMLVALRYDPYEIIVVDNAPSSDQTRRAIETTFADDTRLRYVLEPRQGSSYAKNRGVAESKGEIVAFTDDDVIVDPWWLDGIVRGFRQADDVACVTGLIPTARLDTTAQLYFDRRQAWGTTFDRRIFDLAEHRDESPLYPYSAGVFGAGANFAMTRAALTNLGGFDEVLGAGTRCGGGEDLEMFMRTILAGHRLVYEPSAVVAHVHRANPGDLAKQMRSYGSGATAALTAILLHHRRARRELPFKIIIGVIRIAKAGERTKDDVGLPPGMLAKERRGMLLGPWLYFQGRVRLRRQGAPPSWTRKSSDIATLLAVIRRHTARISLNLLEHANTLSTPSPGSPARLVTARPGSWTRSPIRRRGARRLSAMLPRLAASKASARRNVNSS